MKFKGIVSGFLSLVLVLGQACLANDNEKTNSENYEYFTTLMTYASELYIDEDITAEEIIDEAIKKALQENPEFLNALLKAGFSSLDKYSEYYTAEEFLDYMNNMNHVFYGIGVVIQQNGDYIEITECMEEGSAYSAGMLAGDKIIRVDGKDAVKKSMNEVQSMIVGELDTEVEVTVLRQDKEITFKLKRKAVSAQTIDYIIFENNIGYIDIVNFANQTDAEFAQTLKTFDEYGVENIILDLRGNPGGYLLSAVNIAKQVVPEGVIAKTVYRQEEKNETFYSELKDTKYKFAVLVNGNTASAAEILSSAMQESGVATLVGTTTYGKGVIQDMYRLASGGFKLTTGYYLTRNGNEINEKGIEPDEYIVNPMQRVNMSKYTQFDYKTKPKVGENHENVRAAKERLSGLGYYVGEINSIFDEELEKAVYNFQEDTKLYPYGVLDISTQVKIENEFYVTEEVVDKQFEKAYELMGGNIEDLE